MNIDRRSRDVIVGALDRMGAVGPVGSGEYNVADAIIGDLDEAGMQITNKIDLTDNYADQIGEALEREEPRPVDLIRLANKASNQIDDLTEALKRAEEV